MSTDTVEKNSDVSLVENEQEFIAKIQKTLRALENAVPKGKKESKEKKSTQEQAEKCPFPNHKGYTALWEYLSSEQQKHMKNNIRITIDGKIEMMGKKFSLLQAPHDGENIFASHYKDATGNTGLPWVSYFEGKGAFEAAKKQGKKIFQTVGEADAFINAFPGITIQDKIFAFVTLFNLGKTGLFQKNWNSWLNLPGTATTYEAIGKPWRGHIMLSQPNRDNYPLEGKAPYRAVRWDNEHAQPYIIAVAAGHKNMIPVLAFEDITK